MIHMKYTFHWAMSQGLSSQILYIYLIPCGERSDVSGIPPVLHHKEYVIDSVVPAGCWPAADRPLLRFFGNYRASLLLRLQQEPISMRNFILPCDYGSFIYAPAHSCAISPHI